MNSKIFRIALNASKNAGHNSVAVADWQYEKMIKDVDAMAKAIEIDTKTRIPSEYEGAVQSALTQAIRIWGEFTPGINLVKDYIKSLVDLKFGQTYRHQAAQVKKLWNEFKKSTGHPSEEVGDVDRTDELLDIAVEAINSFSDRMKQLLRRETLFRLYLTKTNSPLRYLIPNAKEKLTEKNFKSVLSSLGLSVSADDDHLDLARQIEKMLDQAFKDFKIEESKPPKPST